MILFLLIPDIIWWWTRFSFCPIAFFNSETSMASANNQHRLGVANKWPHSGRSQQVNEESKLVVLGVSSKFWVDRWIRLQHE